MTPNEIYTIRPYRPSDKAFIMATFLRGVYYGNEYYKMIPKDEFMNSYQIVGQALLISNKTDIRVACLVDDPDIMIGYAILNKDHSVIHWGHIKSAWRQQGIFKALIPVIPSVSTHFTTLGLKLMKKYDITFNPFAN